MRFDLTDFRSRVTRSAYRLDEIFKLIDYAEALADYAEVLEQRLIELEDPKAPVPVFSRDRKEIAGAVESLGRASQILGIPIIVDPDAKGSIRLFKTRELDNLIRNLAIGGRIRPDGTIELDHVSVPRATVSPTPYRLTVPEVSEKAKDEIRIAIEKIARDFQAWGTAAGRRLRDCGLFDTGWPFDRTSVDHVLKPGTRAGRRPPDPGVLPAPAPLRRTIGGLDSPLMRAALADGAHFELIYEAPDGRSNVVQARDSQERDHG